MRFILSCLTVIWAAAAGVTGAAQQRGTYIPLAVPAGSAYPFPTAANRLINIRDRQEAHEMRAHAWSIFSGLTQPIAGKSDTAAFATWFTKCDAFLNVKCPESSDAKMELEIANTTRLMHAAEIPPQFLSDAENEFVANGRISAKLLRAVAQANPLAIVLFNEEALSHIHKFRLWDSSELDSINKEFGYLGAPVAEREIPPFPPKAVVLKTEWRIVPHKQGGSREVVWAWDTRRVFLQPPESNSEGIAHHDGQGGWSRKYFVKLVEGECKPGIGDQKVPDIPLSCFFHFQLTDDDARGINELVKEGVIAKAASAGDYAILLGLHVITREIPDWTWATFWWHDHPNDGPYAEGRPDTVPPLWRNYLMDTTLSMRTPAESDGKEKICFNPYLEAFLENGLSSNCMNCHSRSVYPPVDFPAIPWRRDPQRFPQDSYYEGETSLSFLWSIRDNASEGHRRFLQAFQLALQELQSGK